MLCLLCSSLLLNFRQKIHLTSWPVQPSLNVHILKSEKRKFKALWILSVKLLLVYLLKYRQITLIIVLFNSKWNMETYFRQFHCYLDNWNYKHISYNAQMKWYNLSVKHWGLFRWRLQLVFKSFPYCWVE